MIIGIPMSSLFKMRFLCVKNYPHTLPSLEGLSPVETETGTKQSLQKRILALISSAMASLRRLLQRDASPAAPWPTPDESYASPASHAHRERAETAPRRSWRPAARPFRCPTRSRHGSRASRATSSTVRVVARRPLRPRPRRMATTWRVQVRRLALRCRTQL